MCNLSIEDTSNWYRYQCKEKHLEEALITIHIGTLLTKGQSLLSLIALKIRFRESFLWNNYGTLMIPVAIYGNVSIEFSGRKLYPLFQQQQAKPQLGSARLFHLGLVLRKLAAEEVSVAENCQSCRSGSGCWMENTCIANTSKSAREKIKSGYVSSLQAIFLPRLQESILFGCLIKKKKSQSVIVKTSSGKCNSLTRNYMSYLSPPKLLLQEVRAGEMYCIRTCASDACQSYFPMALQQFLPHR